MKFHRTREIVFISNRPDDTEYVRDVAETVLAGCQDQGPRWRPADSGQLWKIAFGPRAGILGVRLHERPCCAKVFYDDRLRTRVRTFLGLAKGRQAYRFGLRLRQAGIRCPQMLGYAERRPHGPVVLISELVADGMRLDHWSREHGVSRDAVAALARFLRHMHDQGVFHIDLSPRNILIRAGAGGHELFLLDYEDARFVRRVGRRIRLANLHHLHERVIPYVPVRDRLHFLHEYAATDDRAWRDALCRMIDRTEGSNNGTHQP